MRHALFQVAEVDAHLIPDFLGLVAAVHSVLGGPVLVETVAGLSTYRVEVA